ncbi:AAA family ATPase [Nocardiopsis sp. MT53]|uniref:Phosphoribulokinase n=1 Tax=Nocardiopsis changdeensis TaxID=2831969 RepID=A0ABX8BYK4_9ACTN|nr:AAA family ATPase [Nocardiopsis changdeensis]QUX25896.1 phosphoribulokinase [Nocardiopsis changdeensis]QYX40366.1 AAA family ATPase [Nocardiopsis sp. MT53]
METDRAGWDDRLAAAVPGDRGRVRVVTVEGRSGSGKSTVAERLRAALAARGTAVAVLPMDDLYPGWHGLAQAPELLVEWVLEPLARGSAARWRRYDWARGRFSREEYSLPGPVAAGGVLVVEGCGSGARVVRPHVDLSVWVDAPDAVRAQRLDARGDAGLYAPFRRVWADQEAVFYAAERPREHAGAVVGNTRGTDLTTPRP